METKIVDLSSRPWARRREYQNFIGRYKKHECGLWFDTEVAAKRVKLVADAFLELPWQLIELAREYQLTVSISSMDYTSDGNSATIYADWDNTNDKDVAPHVHFGLRSLQTQLLKPHFTHELSHLWFRRRCSLAQRAEYAKFLLATMKRGELEVTEYVHDTYFVDYLEYAENADSTRTAKSRADIIKMKLNRWIEESFCETVAAIKFPGYPFSEWVTTVDLKKRSKVIEKLLPLSVYLAPAR